ncbi:hypothetical protein [Mucilaginibacter sp.]|uniref:hypothetical protein n=1 Tax=Mucilaginibacter sp. TaxID=1882438 RepID=UPI00284552AE|nr:hypothetical protein [Mucilaginibacter sp.]MDR3693750.1 hypothetical protein [Mucilaginibacter sp.]
MKSILNFFLFTCAVFGLPAIANSQNLPADSVTKAVSDSISAEKKQKTDSITFHRDYVMGKMDTTNVIATFEMNDSLKVFVKTKTKDKYGQYNKRLLWAKLKKVHLLVKEGVLLEIEATTDIGVFRNKYAVIDLLHFGTRGGDTLRYESQKYRYDAKNLYIFLDDVITYTPMRSYTDLPYAEFDITLTPDSAHRLYQVKESTSLNAYFNVSAFTDIKGLNGSPNGIAQFNAEAKFITNTRNFRNGATIPFNYLSFMGGLSKYDSQFKGTMLFHKDSVSRRDLFQRSTYSIGFKFNLLHGYPSPYPRHLFSDWQINVGYNFIGSQVADTSFKDQSRTIIDTSFRTVTLNDIYIEPKFTLSRHGNFAFSLAIPVHMISIMGSANIKNDQFQYWAAPTMELMYYSQKDSGSKLFFRYRYYSNLSDNTQAFTQIQLGYSINLSSLWGPGN